jgi:hypothetical protein
MPVISVITGQLAEGQHAFVAPLLGPIDGYMDT